MLRDEVEQYTKLTGEDGWKVPIMKVGAYLDGYNKGLEALDKIKDEIKDKTYFINETTEKEGIDFKTVEKIIDKYKAESEEV